MWIRSEGAFEALIEPDLFGAAQAIIRARSTRLSDGEMLDGLKLLLKARGYLSGLVIDETELLPSSSSYRGRFGSLVQAYKLIGYTPERDLEYIAINQHLRTLHPQMIAEAIDELRAAGGAVEHEARTGLLTVNQEFTASIVIVRCQEVYTGTLRWHIRFDTSLAPDLTIAVRMDQENKRRLDYFLLPRLDQSAPQLRLGEHNGCWIEAYRTNTLEPFFAMAERVKLMEVA